jgi:O-antigen biosynthesis protein
MAQDNPARISVVVASRDRPRELSRCLVALEQTVWPLVEIVVVADRAGRDAVGERAGTGVVAFDQPNLAAARNAGLGAAGGDIIAFIDDDAVPEPMWLAALARAFDDGGVGAATGPVLGRNGISLQSGAQMIVSDATTVNAPARAEFGRAIPGRAPKTVGTNMAFRADLLRAAGGFDETFRFYLEDADLNMRLGAMGAVTAYAPGAVVHHATAASPRRRADRAPRDLFDIGRSTAAFVLRHHSAGGVREALDAARSREWVRALGGLETGALEPRQVRRLLAGYDAGVAEGLALGQPKLRVFAGAPAFRPRRHRAARHGIVAGFGRKRAAAREKARELREAGVTVSLFLFSATGLYHRVRHEGGIWVQTGGLWGRSERTGALLQPATRKSRLEAEIARVAEPRGLDGVADWNFAGLRGVRSERFPFF